MCAVDEPANPAPCPAAGEPPSKAGVAVGAGGKRPVLDEAGAGAGGGKSPAWPAGAGAGPAPPKELKVTGPPNPPGRTPPAAVVPNGCWAGAGINVV